MNIQEDFKKITFDITITKCRDCHYVTNSVREHNCSFTSPPYPTVWYCTHKDRKAPFGETFLMDEYKIDKYCPL